MARSLAATLTKEHSHGRKFSNVSTISGIKDTADFKCNGTVDPTQRVYVEEGLFDRLSKTTERLNNGLEVLKRSQIENQIPNY